MTLHQSLFASALFPNRHEQKFLNEFFAGVSNGTYVDVGGNIPDGAVSTPFHARGWRGLVIEPIPRWVQAYRDAGVRVWQGVVLDVAAAEKGSATLHLSDGDGDASSLAPEKTKPGILSGNTLEVEVKTLTQVCAAHDIPAKVDLLHIDTEYTEPEVVRGFDWEKYDVTLALIEDLAFDYALHNEMTARGFKRVRRTGFNSWYVKNEMPFPVSVFGRWQMFRKYTLGILPRRFRYWLKGNALTKQ